MDYKENGQKLNVNVRDENGKLIFDEYEKKNWW